MPDHQARRAGEQRGSILGAADRDEWGIMIQKIGEALLVSAWIITALAGMVIPLVIWRIWQETVNAREKKSD